MSQPLHRGRCLCGQTTYEISAPAGLTCLCHCEDCRRASGAPFVAWTFFPAGSLRWTAQTPRLLHFASRERTFCPDCGTPLSFFDPSLPHQYEVTTCSLENPENYPPTAQDWPQDRLPWMDHAADLPNLTGQEQTASPT
jgi:hypothetical protein